MEDLIIIKENKVFATSRMVAAKFGKRHTDVIRSIKNLEDVDGFNGRNFASVDYLDEKGETRPEFIMTKDGFSFLVMGFTGKKAARFKIDFINAFNKAEEKLKVSQSTPMGIEEIIILQMQGRIEDRKRIQTLEDKVGLILKEKEEAENELLLIERSAEKMPEESLRAKIRRIVNVYANAKGLKQQDLWRKIYDRLLYVYRISIRSYKKVTDKETLLDVAERIGCIDKIYIIVSNEFVI